MSSRKNYPLFLTPDCPLLDAGCGYIDEYPYLLGKASCVYVVPDTNNLHGIPDSNIVNIGFHYFDWNYSNVGGDGNRNYEAFGHGFPCRPSVYFYYSRWGEARRSPEG